MTPDEVNRTAIIGIVAMAVIGGLIYMASWALGEDAPVQVAGATVQTVPVSAPASIGEPQPDSTSAIEEPRATFSVELEAAQDDASTTTTTVSATNTSPATSTTVPTTTSSVTTTTRVPPTTTTVKPTTTTTSTTLFASTTTTTRVPPTTTTTIRPTTTTTVRPTTTTTVKPTTTTTTTTLPPTTTTTTVPPATTTTTTTPLPTTTTTTTVPPTTTTTTIPLPGLLVHKFEGHDHGDAGEWEAHIKIEIRDENDARAPFAAVRVTWDGSTAGSEWLGSDKDGKIDTRLGLFADPSITFRITNVLLSGYTYRPSHNDVSSTLVIAGPN